MGTYLNPSSMNFKINTNGQIYIDKTALIAFTNKLINTPQRFICVSRPRRFGKTMAAEMLAAYYSSAENTQDLFQEFCIARDSSFEKCINKFDVIKVDMQSFLSKGKDVAGMLALLTEYLVAELSDQYADVRFLNKNDLSEVFSNIFSAQGKQFIFIVDEWDCVMRRLHDDDEQKVYLDFLRNLLKNQPYVALAYMTGILPIKKYGEHSTLNMFYEYSMIDSAEISDCFGFTEAEVLALCEQYHMDFACMREWYDGYHLLSNVGGKRVEYSIYSPNSIIEAIKRGQYECYWNLTETYDALKKYIQLNMDGLKDAVIEMLSGACIKIDTGIFKNDMTDFHFRDEVLTLLVHLGYLTYNQDTQCVSIPNKEVEKEFIRSVKSSSMYKGLGNSIEMSQQGLKSTQFEDFLAEQLQDEEFKKEYDALEPEFAIIQQMIDAGRIAAMTQQ